MAGTRGAGRKHDMPSLWAMQLMGVAPLPPSRSRGIWYIWHWCCLLFISSKLPRCARRALRCSPSKELLSGGGRGLGSHWVAHACMGVASPCVCRKPVAEGGASVDLRVLRGARNRSIIWVRGPGRDSSALTHCLMRDRGGGGGFSADARDPVSCWWGGGGVQCGRWCWWVSVGLGAGGGGGRWG
jgi:hypothetical protein